MNAPASIRPRTPYPVTVHTWTCRKDPAHTITISNGGFPQRAGLKEEIVAAWTKVKKKNEDDLFCLECGARVDYLANTEKT